MIAFTKSINPTSVLTKLDAVEDDQFTVKDEYLYIGDLNLIMAVKAGGEHIRQARLTAPSLLRMFPLDIYPVLAEDNLGNPDPIDLRFDNPLALVKSEGLYAEVLNDGTPTTDHDYWVAVMLADGKFAPALGDIFTKRVTFSGTIAAKEWSSLTLSGLEDLPAGRYQLVGADIRSGSGIAFRFIPVGGGWRSGGFTHWRYSTAFDFQRQGKMGVWFEFNHNTPPKLEIFEMGTETPEYGYVDLIKIAA
jgi:hypothetical protein